MNPEKITRYPFAAHPGAKPLYVTRAHGTRFYIYDDKMPSKERPILDAAGGAMVATIGHGRREVADAFARAAIDLTYAVPPFASRDRLELIELLQDQWLPAGLTRAMFMTSGSESVEVAIRLARQHHLSAGRKSRWKVIGRDLSFHGSTLATLSVGGHTGRRRGMEPWLADLPKAPACFCLRCPFDEIWPDCKVQCASALEALIDREGADSIAAFIAEPIGGSTVGALVPPDDYWRTIVGICRRYGILVIADEVLTGFGRTGRAMAIDHWGVVPDILIAGKGLAAGYAPICGVFAQEHVIEQLAYAGHEVGFSTYSAHPAACAAACAVLRILDNEGLVARAWQMGERLARRLLTLSTHKHVGEIRGRGLLQSVELVADRETLTPFPPKAQLARNVVAWGLSEGVFFYAGGCEPARDVVTLAPPFIVRDEEIDTMVSVLERAIDRAAGYAAP